MILLLAAVSVVTFTLVSISRSTVTGKCRSDGTGLDE